MIFQANGMTMVLAKKDNILRALCFCEESQQWITDWSLEVKEFQNVWKIKKNIASQIEKHFDSGKANEPLTVSEMPSNDDRDKYEKEWFVMCLQFDIDGINDENFYDKLFQNIKSDSVHIFDDTFLMMNGVLLSPQQCNLQCAQFEKSQKFMHFLLFSDACICIESLKSLQTFATLDNSRKLFLADSSQCKQACVGNKHFTCGSSPSPGNKYVYSSVYRTLFGDRKIRLPTQQYQYSKYYGFYPWQTDFSNKFVDDLNLFATFVSVNLQIPFELMKNYRKIHIAGHKHALQMKLETYVNNNQLFTEINGFGNPVDPMTIIDANNAQRNSQPFNTVPTFPINHYQTIIENSHSYKPGILLSNKNVFDPTDSNTRRSRSRRRLSDEELDPYFVKGGIKQENLDFYNKPLTHFDIVGISQQESNIKLDQFHSDMESPAIPFQRLNTNRFNDVSKSDMTFSPSFGYTTLKNMQRNMIHFDIQTLFLKIQILTNVLNHCVKQMGNKQMFLNFWSLSIQDTNILEHLKLFTEIFDNIKHIWPNYIQETNDESIQGVCFKHFTEVAQIRYELYKTLMQKSEGSYAGMKIDWKGIKLNGLFTFNKKNVFLDLYCETTGVATHSVPIMDIEQVSRMYLSVVSTIAVVDRIEIGQREILKQAGWKQYLQIPIYIIFKLTTNVGTVYFIQPHFVHLTLNNIFDPQIEAKMTQQFSIYFFVSFFFIKLYILFCYFGNLFFQMQSF